MHSHTPHDRQTAHQPEPQRNSGRPTAAGEINSWDQGEAMPAAGPPRTARSAGDSLSVCVCASVLLWIPDQLAWDPVLVGHTCLPAARHIVTAAQATALPQVEVGR